MTLKRPRNASEHALLDAMLAHGMTDRQIEQHFGGRVCLCGIGPIAVCAHHAIRLVEDETATERRAREREERREAYDAKRERSRARYRRLVRQGE